MRLLDEFETIARVADGYSIGRVSDGEVKIATGRSKKLQPYNARLAGLIREALRVSGSGRFLAGVARKDNRSPKPHHVYECWAQPMRAHYTANLYGSCYISRPDCAPWIDTPNYWSAVEALWRGLDVALVAGSDESLTAKHLASARSVLEIAAPPADAFAVYDQLLGMIRDLAGGRRIFLCLGPTATALALDLSRAGKHAIDLGIIGKYMRIPE